MSRRRNEKVLIELNYDELERLIYRKSKEANDNLYGGLIPFINRLMDEHEQVLQELDYIKAYIQNQSSVKEAIEVVGLDEVSEPSEPKIVNKFTEAYDKLTDNQRENLANMIKNNVVSPLSGINNHPPIKLPNINFKGND